VTPAEELPRFSLVVATIGREAELVSLLESLKGNDDLDLEVIIVDQNRDDRLAPVLADRGREFRLVRLRSTVGNACFARNLGLRAARGDIVCFPDDDCRIPPGALQRVGRLFAKRPDLQIVTGRAITADGATSSGRWRAESGPIGLRDVWTSVIEFALFVRRSCALSIGGFDDRLGPGAPCGSAEGNDFVARAIAAGHIAFYCAELGIEHPDKRFSPVAVERAVEYGRGLGLVLVRHAAGIVPCLWYLARPLAGAVLSMLTLRRVRWTYYCLTFLGRLEGMLCPPFGMEGQPLPLSPEHSDPRRRLRIAIGIASTGRPALLHNALEALRRQERSADRIIVCHAAPGDVSEESRQMAGIEFVSAPAGLARQRNAILERTEGDDLLVFFDDDFIPAPGYLGAMELLFNEGPHIVIATGDVVADGARSRPLDIAQAADLLRQARTSHPSRLLPAYNAYGCNMAVRLAAVRSRRLHFDESLPLYALYEDIDFSRQLAPHGAIRAFTGARGVHLGTPAGRMSARRLGYSQIANPQYLVRKGTFHWSHAWKSMLRHCCANVLGSFSPAERAFRVRRLAGNLVALWHWMRGAIAPYRALDL
jgi:glycosyltransferase involved in cell wall biosynthesis